VEHLLHRTQSELHLCRAIFAIPLTIVAAFATPGLAGSIPPPDESHALQAIGVCGSRHFETSLEFCDMRDQHVYRYIKIG
jgi:hypothetical protein